jgi:hypothetical protein
MEFAKTRVQLRQEKGVRTPRNPFWVVTQVYQKEGLRSLYKGCGALVVVSSFLDPILQCLHSKFIFELFTFVLADFLLRFIYTSCCSTYLTGGQYRDR